MIAWLLALAVAATPLEETQMAQLEKARAEIANQVHLHAFDLVDEMVYGWTQDAVFDKPTPVVVAGVTVPVGLGSGLQAQVENHLSAVIAENPSTNVQLVHCPQCTAVVVHSGPEGTVVSRGYDNPQVLEELGATTGQHALFVDIEAEGTFLVLRSRLTRLTPELPIVWSHTIATSAATPALLRESSDLKSAEQARKDYLDALTDRGPIHVPVRLAVRNYARPFTENAFPAPPMLWVQTGAELGATQARVWTAGLHVGYSFIPQAYQGLMAEARINRLITGKSRSLTRPDVYAFAGGAVVSVWGPGIASFLPDPIDLDSLLAANLLTGPRTSFGTLQIGADMRIGNRIGFSTFLETMPSLANSRNLGDHIVLFGIGFQSWGTEVTLWF